MRLYSSLDHLGSAYMHVAMEIPLFVSCCDTTPKWTVQSATVPSLLRDEKSPLSIVGVGAEVVLVVDRVVDAVVDGVVDAVVDGVVDAVVDGVVDAIVDGVVDAEVVGVVHGVVDAVVLGVVNADVLEADVVVEIVVVKAAVVDEGVGESGVEAPSYRPKSLISSVNPPYSPPAATPREIWCVASAAVKSAEKGIQTPVSEEAEMLASNTIPISEMTTSTEHCTGGSVGMPGSIL